MLTHSLVTVIVDFPSRPCTKMVPMTMPCKWLALDSSWIGALCSPVFVFSFCSWPRSSSFKAGMEVFQASLHKVEDELPPQQVRIDVEIKERAVSMDVDDPTPASLSAPLPISQQSLPPPKGMVKSGLRAVV